jgi:hypothetical protein
MSDHGLNSGAAIAICGKVEIVSTMARIRTALESSSARERVGAEGPYGERERRR